MAAKVRVTFLGTSSAAPTRDRGLPAIVVRREGHVILMDCGEGVQRQILEESVGLGKDLTVLVTHLHGDHVSGLLGLLQTMSMAGRKKPVDMVAPAKLLKWLDVTSDLLNVGLTFPIRFVPARPGVVLRYRDFRIRAARATHSVDAFSYVVEEGPRSGVFHPDRARALRVPEGKLWSTLQKGRSVKVGDRRVSPSEVTGPRRRGVKIGYSGDTRPSPSLVRFFRGCDLLIFDSTFRASDAAKAKERKHSTSVEAAAVAKRAKVRKLALTHFSARYVETGPLVREARKVFPETVAAFDGLTLEVSPSPG
ncbi:MAG: ribonuclease Z [Nitrososphaerota archaeon]|nr:ribonuclease Z [Nitrososphaerota archaeon]